MNQCYYVYSQMMTSHTEKLYDTLDQHIFSEMWNRIELVSMQAGYTDVDIESSFGIYLQIYLAVPDDIHTFTHAVA